MNIQGWFPLGLTALISLQSKNIVEWETTDKNDSTFVYEGGKKSDHTGNTDAICTKYSTSPLHGDIPSVLQRTLEGVGCKNPDQRLSLAPPFHQKQTV